MDWLKAHDLNSHLVERYRHRENAVTAVTLSHVKRTRWNLSSMPNGWHHGEGDLLLCRDHKIDDRNSRDFELRWTKPKILAKVLEGGVSGLVTDLDSDNGAVKYHLEGMKAYARE